MNAEIKALWLAALRSGKYRKGRDVLKEKTPQGPEYCCLGVLCDLHRKAVKKNRWYKSESIGGLTYQGEAFILPPDVAEWAGLSDTNPVVGTITLTHLNDDRLDRPFTDIANQIEEYL